MSETNDKLENFERAFRDGTGGCRRTCYCGITYFEDDSVYTWEPGELEELREKAGFANARVVTLDRVSDMTFEDRSFVTDCDCWRARALEIIAFLDSHGHSIAEYFSLERERKIVAASHSPSIREPKVKT